MQQETIEHQTEYISTIQRLTANESDIAAEQIDNMHLGVKTIIGSRTYYFITRLLRTSGKLIC